MGQRGKKAGKRPATGKVHLPPGEVLQQIPGTIHWCEKTGKALGIVGRDVPARLVVDDGNGSLRALTRAERRAYRAWERGQR